MKHASMKVAMAALAFAAACAPEPTAPDMSALTPRASQAVVPSAGTVVYNNIPSPLPGNVPSQGYQCCQTAELGDYVALAGTARRARSATVLMSSWSLHSNYPTMDVAGYTHPITLNIYNVNTSGPTPALGALIGTVTQSFLIPWRPAADPTCPGGTAWRATGGSCYNGFAFTIEFDLRTLALTLPNEFIFGVAFNTNSWGYQPIGQPGPYESLNVGFANVGGAAVPPSVGVDVEPDAAFWNTGVAAWYSDGGAAGFSIFRRDTGWLDYPPAVRFNTIALAASAADCKNGGWQSLARADGSGFTNQGDCVSYTRNGK
ncbi:MAG: hypothetical protein IPP90_13750 [Gemmatimonadaceae bacterium]|nr:hypothetical protein [Gemmatimonadaceae bacterium]